MLLASVSAFAQFSRDQKGELLGEIDQVLTKKAFVPGVDLRKWHTFIDKRQDQLDAADNPRQFASVVNGALREFGLSHIILVRDHVRRYWGGDDALHAQQRGRFIRSPELGWLDDDTAVLRIPSFEDGYDPRDVADMVDQAKDAKYMIVDLRGDPGGEMDNMRQFLGLVLPSNTPVGTFVSKWMAEEYESAKGGTEDPVSIAKWAHRELTPLKSGIAPFNGKIAVLIDGNSASAAEIVANALREAKHSPLVGSPTAGAVLVSEFNRLSYGFSLQFPVGDYVSHNGHRLEGHPIKPDVAALGDDAIDKAVDALKTPAK